MQNLIIPISGLHSNLETRLLRDGDTHILHNLTIEDGGVKTITPPRKSTATTSSTIEYYHEKADKWLSLQGGKVYGPDGAYINTDGYISSVAFMGNIVMMYSGNETRYAIYDGDYRYLGKIPELPKLNITIKSTIYTTLTTEKYYSDEAELSETDEGLKWINASKGFFDECLNNLYKQGAYIDRTLVRMALRLFDGNYVAYSPIYYIEDSDIPIKVIEYPWLANKNYQIGRDNENFFTAARYTSSERSQYFTAVRGFIPIFKLEDYDLKRWKDIISGIELFATAPIMGHKEEHVETNEKQTLLEDGQLSAIVNISTNKKHERYVLKNAGEIKEEISKTSLFYKIAEFDLEGNEVWRLENTAPSQLAMQTTLPIEEMPHELTEARYKYTYNRKIHLAGISEWLRDAYMEYSRAGLTSKKISQITAEVTIRTTEGERNVITTKMQPEINETEGNLSLTPLLCYPDAKASNMRLHICDGYSLKYKDFPLTAHDTLNIAYFLNEVKDSKDDETDINVDFSDNNAIAETRKSNGEDQFIKTIKEKFAEKGDYSGIYTFTFAAIQQTPKTWNMNIAFDDGSTVPDEVINIFQYGLRLFINGEELFSNDFLQPTDKIKQGDKITVTVKKTTDRLTGIVPIPIDGEGWTSVGTNEADFVLENDKIVSFTLKNISENRKLERKHLMRVSEVDNPLFFPVKSTYAFDTEIIAVCSNTVAVSQGQFGQHPLYVFTRGGIWLMTIDMSGAGTYIAQVPCSREICNNPQGVTVTDKGVVFTTDKGIMLINGSESVNLSLTISGSNTPELRQENDVMQHICAIAGKEMQRKRIPFREYMKGAFTAFDYKTSLLYVCNANQDYTYVYNMISGAWSTADGKYESKIEYPGTLIMIGRTTEDGITIYQKCTFDKGDNLVENIPAVMMTQECTFGNTGFKRIREAALRITLHANKAGFYVLGSPDGACWTLIGGKEFVKQQPELRRDLITKFKRSKAYRFFTFAFVGIIRSDTKIAMAEVMVQAEFQNRIR